MRCHRHTVAAHCVVDVASGLLFLDCSNNYFGDESAKALAKALHEDRWLKGLDLAQNCIGAAGVPSRQGHKDKGSPSCRMHRSTPCAELVK